MARSLRSGNKDNWAVGITEAKHAERMKTSKVSLFILGVAFFLNAIWEMAQMPAYAAGTESVSKRVVFCLVSAVADAIYVLLLYWTVRLITGRAEWFSSLNPKYIVTIVTVGFLAAVIIELLNLKLGVWRYSRSMPIIPIVGIGLWPALQLMIVPILVLWVVTCIL